MYQQFRPAEPFTSLIDAYWINRPDAGATFDRVLPDGCIDLVFRGGIDDGRLFTSALIERPAYFSTPVRGWFAGVRLRPAMARALFDLDPIDCRDRDIAAAEIDPRFAALEDELRCCSSPEQALAVLKRAVDRRLAHGIRHAAPRRVQEAISLLAREPVAMVARRVGASERSLHRELVAWSGLAPKAMARILRMQRCLTALRTRHEPLAFTALRLGYADQAHMTRELKALTGFTPTELHPVRNLQDAA